MGRVHRQEMGKQFITSCSLGMYAGGPVDHGIQYNDDIKIWTLDAPVTDFGKEPIDPLGSHEKWQRWANKNMRKN